MEKAIGISEGALQETLRSYNEYAEKGEDPEFHKGKKWLAPLVHPPCWQLSPTSDNVRYVSFGLENSRVTRPVRSRSLFTLVDLFEEDAHLTILFMTGTEQLVVGERREFSQIAE